MKGLTIKAALLVGFGLTLGVWLLVGYQVTRRMADVQRDVGAANARYLQAQDLLSTVRSQILVASVAVRDALLAPTPRVTQDDVAQLDASYRAIDRALGEYVPILDSDAERERVARLRQEIEQFRRETADVLTTDSTRWPAEARTLLHRFMPRREAVIRVSEEIQALNRAAFVEQQAGIAAMYAATQRQVWARLGVALGISLGIALLASTYAGRLERRLVRQRAIEERNASELQRLSARLVRAREEEQRRISRELHDEVGQALTAVKMELTGAQRRMQGSAVPPAVLDAAQSITDTALHAVRDLSRLLHPAALDDLGLVVALDAYIAEFGARHRIRADFVHEGLEERLPAEVEAAAYRIVQEALTNVARHAAATTCGVHLQRVGGSLDIAVRDDGVGFDPMEVERSGGRRGLGLVGLRERVSYLRGSVRIESAPHRGTSIFVTLPAGAHAHAEDAGNREAAALQQGEPDAAAREAAIHG